MSICYISDERKHFDKNFYRCRILSKDEDGIELEVEFTSSDKVFMDYKLSIGKRNIILYDSVELKKYLILDADVKYYQLCKLYEINERVILRANNYLYCSNEFSIEEIDSHFTVNKIRIYSDFIAELNNHPSLQQKDNSINLMDVKQTRREKLVQSNNIKTVAINESWSINMESISKLAINFYPYIELSLIEPIDYRKVETYIFEITVFMELYYPNKFEINKIEVQIGNHFYGMSLIYAKYERTGFSLEQSVKLPLLDFLERCYRISRDNKVMHNITSVVMDESKCIELVFIRLYNFIEEYYKEFWPNEKCIRSSLKKYYYKEDVSEDKLINMTEDIIALRNHYIHEGFHIQNCTINRRNHLTNRPEIQGVNIEWIMERQKILQVIAYEIIYKEILLLEDDEYDIPKTR